MKRNTHPFWKRPENLTRLREVYPAAPWRDVFAAFPGKSRIAITNAAKRMKIKRVAARESYAAKEPVIRALQQRRMALRMSQVDLSRKMGYQQKFVQEHEAGTKQCSYASLQRWAKSLGMVLTAVVPQTNRAAVTMLHNTAQKDMEVWRKRAA